MFIEKLEELIRIYKPKDELICYRRLFDYYSYDLHFSSDIKKNQEIISKEREKCIRKIVKHNYKELFVLATKVNFPTEIGKILGKIKRLDLTIVRYVEKEVSSKNRNKATMSRSFISAYYFNKKIDFTIINKWSTNKKVDYLVNLPICEDVINYLNGKGETLKEKFWNKKEVEMSAETIINNQLLSNYVKYKNYNKAIFLITSLIHREIEYDKDLAYIALKEIVKDKKQINNLSQYGINKIIKNLREKE